MIVAYVLTIITIFFGLTGILSLPFALIIGLLGVSISPIIAMFLPSVAAWWLIDYFWVLADVGRLPIILLGFAFVWSPIYAAMQRGKLTKSGTDFLYAAGWGAFFMGLLRCFMDDPIRWI